MLSLNSVSAWVEVDGKELEQYGVEEDSDLNQVTCWIATQVDKSFSVGFRDNAVNREHSLASNIQLDGSTVGGKVLRPLTGVPGIPQNSPALRTIVQNDQVLSMTTSRAFMFSKLELTEEDAYLNQVSAHLGEIQIRINRVQYRGSIPFEAVVGGPGHARVHERSKKAVTHYVSYGQETQTRPQTSCSIKNLDDVPLATFIFKYRDFGLLQANGIIPKPPPGRKPIVSDEVLDLTIGNNVKPEAVDEEIEIVDDTPQSRKRTVLPKRGRENEARPAKRIKREFVSTGEVIDLT